MGGTWTPVRMSFIHTVMPARREGGRWVWWPKLCRQKSALHFRAERDNRELCTWEEHGDVESAYIEETLEDFTLQASDPEAALLHLKGITKPFTRFIALFPSFVFICDLSQTTYIGLQKSQACLFPLCHLKFRVRRKGGWQTVTSHYGVLNDKVVKLCFQTTFRPKHKLPKITHCCPS